ncbi:MAG: transcriptional regulator [Actinobacteria bacterium]|nr:MAG: transcriptional regulator [Actinomycetota bacterium]
MAGPDFAQIPTIIAMLNNRTRRQVCEYLAMQPLTMRQLEQYVSVKQPTFSYHMGALFDSKLVTWRFGDEHLFLSTPHITVLQRYTCEVLGTPDTRAAQNLLGGTALEQLGR